MQVPLGLGSYKRPFGRAPAIVLKNRFLERSPVNLIEDIALLSRPGSSFAAAIGDSPARAQYSRPGLFGGDLFVVSGDTLYRYDGDTATAITGALDNGRIVITDARGAGYERIFLCDGTNLWYYGGLNYVATLNYTAGAIDDDIVRIGAQYYQFTSAANVAQTGSAEGKLYCAVTGTTLRNDSYRIGDTWYRFNDTSTIPNGDGTQASPYFVRAFNSAASNGMAWTNLYNAINGTGGTPGTDYSANIVAHPTVSAVTLNNGNNDDGFIVVRAKQAGVAGNSIVTTHTPQGNARDGAEWEQGTLVGGFDLDGLSAATPYRVFRGANAAAGLENLRKAINASGLPGVDYSASLEAHPYVQANANTATSVSIRGRASGPITPTQTLSVTTVGSADGLAWSSSEPVSAGNALRQIEVPDNQGIISIATLDSFIMCVAANSQRVYFIRPGEVEIDALDFFEAESETDQLEDIISVGDQVWLIGQTSIEPWYTAAPADPAANPFARIQGRPFSIGGIAGTAVRLANSVFLVGNDYIVYRIAGQAQPISNPSIVEAVRKAMKSERENP